MINILKALFKNEKLKEEKMGREQADSWFEFNKMLFGQPSASWSEDVMKVFNLIHRYQPEDIVPKKIKGIPVITCIHSTKRGMALGGSRIFFYRSMANAYRDVLKLAAAMTYKAIYARLALGGGKTVIYARPEEIDEEFLMGYADFLNEINTPVPRFLTGEDVGFTEAMVDAIAKRTTYISGKSQTAGGLGDPSPMTALGIFKSIKAALEVSQIYSGPLRGKTAAVQGAGKVALPLIKMLLEAGAEVFFSENDGAPDAEKRAEAAISLGAKRVPKDKIIQTNCHIFSPCAVGGIINKNTIPQFTGRTRVIIGAANNILDAPEDGITLHEKRFIYLPDYVVNRYGLEWVALEHKGVTDPKEAEKSLTNLESDIRNILEISDEKDMPTSEIADLISRKILDGEVSSVEEGFQALRKEPE